MQLKKIKLKNIRSYLDEEIIFPEKTTLLSGDIGSGKSTILLAIDFSLFGIRRGELSGAALLRNDATEGYVILDFDLDDKEVSIKRTLKRSSTGIVQDSGYLTINDVTEELTPVELKQRVLQLLNYPPDTLTKRSLIYRYTVYTPQEEMKLILLGEKEYRLETLRKVFNIDKYKRIKENSKVIISEIKLKKKEISTSIVDLEDKKVKLQEKIIELAKNQEQILTNKLRISTINELIILKKQNISSIEQEIKKLNDLSREFSLTLQTIQSNENLKSRSLNQLVIIERELNILQSTIKETTLENIKAKIIENEKQIEDLEKQLREVLSKSTEIKSKNRTSQEIKLNITKLDFCPLCKQTVSHEHKVSIIQKEDMQITTLEQDLKLLIENELSLTQKIRSIKELIQNLRNQDREQELNKLKSSEIEKKRQQINILKKEQLEIEELLSNILQKKELLQRELDSLKNIELTYQSTKKELDELLNQHRNLELNLALSNKEQENINKEISNIKQEIELKEKLKEKLNYYVSLQDWFENFFTNIVDIIEKKIMLKVHTDFNSLFQKWFLILMNTDLIKVKLDEEFTPVIEQNSHDIEYENLSGGEKTACALAYRLALNQVINTVLSTINTKDLLILDEPTDGFSSEQLDKIRLVLEELNMNQIIIVSHESKIESFVNNIIKIHKDNHISKVLR